MKNILPTKKRIDTIKEQLPKGFLFMEPAVVLLLSIVVSLTCTVGMLLSGQLTVGSRENSDQISGVRTRLRRIKQECLGVAVAACVGRPLCEGTPATIN